MSFTLLKTIHLFSIATSYGLFVLRGIWALGESSHLQRRWVKIVPHIIDTVLLASAIGLAISIGQYPFTHSWLTAKVLGLALYILLGSLALKRGNTKRIRVAAWIAAQMVFFYIVAVAMRHNPLPWLQP